MVNPSIWDEMSAEDRAAVEDVSGERLSRLFGYMMDVSDERGVEFAKEQGHTFTALGDEDLETLRGISSDLVDNWSENVSERGVDAQAALEYFHQQLEEAATRERGILSATIIITLRQVEGDYADPDDSLVKCR
ncbi:hypothetical protein HORIV_66990 [Vreelandella olivaria]|uniref:Uncharacterized protein n=1 Tax=Vreelandella olivaria TaxID=390919 RepID=A0ABM7GTU7_9GAMM|nr:hypothetical protein HORIV_66990 [Halomonas olivaria]